MGKGASVQEPSLVAIRGGMVQIRYNVQAVIVGEGKDQRNEYQYDYVEVKSSPTKKDIIDLLIRAKYDVNDEFALLQLPNTNQEYIDYRDFIVKCKGLASEVILAL